MRRNPVFLQKPATARSVQWSIRPSLACVVLLTLWPLLCLPTASFADAFANTFVHASVQEDLLDSMSSIRGPAFSTISGGRTFNSGDLLHTHLFLATATANPETGRIALATQQTSLNYSGLAYAGGQVFDTLTFQGSRPATVEFTMSVVGGFFRNASPQGSASFRMQAFLEALGFGVSQMDVTWAAEPGETVQYRYAGEVTNLGRDDEPSLIKGTLSLSLLLQPGAIVPIVADMNLRTVPRGSGAVDANSLFNNTATLSLKLPEDWTFTSQSGTFLTQQSTEGPEPATVSLVALGAVPVALGFVRRRLRR